MVTKLTKKIASSRAFRVASRVGFLLAPQLVLMAFGVYDQVAHAQGLVGAPVDPATGNQMKSDNWPTTDMTPPETSLVLSQLFRPSPHHLPA